MTPGTRRLVVRPKLVLVNIVVTGLAISRQSCILYAPNTVDGSFLVTVRTFHRPMFPDERKLCLAVIK